MFKKLFILGCCVLAFSACDKQENTDKKALEAKAANSKNTITFVTLNSPNTYYVNSDKAFAGLEYDLALLFAAYLNAENQHTATPSENMQVKFIVANSIEEVIANIINKQADIAAADLTVTKEREVLIDFSTPYQDVQQQVVYNQDNKKKSTKKCQGFA